QSVRRPAPAVLRTRSPNSVSATVHRRVRGTPLDALPAAPTAAKASLIEMRPGGTALGRGDGRCPAVPRPAAEVELRRGKPTHREWPCHSPSTGLARNTKSANGPHLPPPPPGKRTRREKQRL